MRRTTGRLAARALFALLALTVEEAGAAEYSGPVWGGSGGTRSYNLDCGSSGVLVGVYGKTGSWIDQIGLTCRSVAANGTLGSEFTRGPVGGTGGSVKSVKCKSGEVVGGIESWSGSYVEKIRLQCDKWRPEYKRIDYLAPIDSFLFGGLGTTGIFGRTPEHNPMVRCPRDKVGKALRGKHGAYVDSMKFVCDAYNQ
jgi:hypothetical protein